MAFGFTRHRLGDMLPVVSMSPGLTLTTTPVVMFSAPVRKAGSYLVEMFTTWTSGALTGTRTATLQFDFVNEVSLSIGGFRNSSTPAAAASVPITASGQSHAVAFTANRTHEFRSYGHIVASDASVLTVTASLSSETVTLHACSFMRLTPMTFHSHP